MTMSHPQRIDFHQRAQKGVIAKLRRTYTEPNLPPSAYAMADETAGVLAAQLTTELCQGEKNWQTTKEKAAECSEIDLAPIDAKLDALMMEGVERYVQSFFMHKALDRYQGKKPSVFYREETIKDNLAYIFKNHLINELDARLRILGLDETSAYLVEGQVIRYAISCSKELFRNEISCGVQPMRGTDKSEQGFAREISGVRGYWREARDKIERYRPGAYDPAHAQKLVRDKLNYRYDISDDDFTFDSKEKQDYEGWCHHMMASSRWKDARDSCMADSQMPRLRETVVDADALTILNAYGHAFKARDAVAHAAVKDGPNKRLNALHEQKDMRAFLSDAYVNHACNRAQEILAEEGFRAEQAMGLHGLLIKMATLAYTKTTGNPSYVLPKQDRDSRGTPQESIHQLRHFWRGLEKELGKMHGIEPTPLLWGHQA